MMCLKCIDFNNRSDRLSITIIQSSGKEIKIEFNLIITSKKTQLFKLLLNYYNCVSELFNHQREMSTVNFHNCY